MPFIQLFCKRITIRATVFSNASSTSAEKDTIVCTYPCCQDSSFYVYLGFETLFTTASQPFPEVQNHPHIYVFCIKFRNDVFTVIYVSFFCINQRESIIRPLSQLANTLINLLNWFGGSVRPQKPNNLG